MCANVDVDSTPPKCLVLDKFAGCSTTASLYTVIKKPNTDNLQPRYFYRERCPKHASIEASYDEANYIFKISTSRPAYCWCKYRYLLQIPENLTLNIACRRCRSHMIGECRVRIVINELGRGRGEGQRRGPKGLKPGWGSWGAGAVFLGGPPLPVTVK